MEKNNLLTTEILCKALKINEGEKFKFVHYINENQNKFIDKIFYIENDEIICADGSEFDINNIVQILAGFYSAVKI